MGWFKNKPTEAESIVDFWQWWSGVRHDVASAISDGSARRFTKAFGERVAAIQDDLEWELTPGADAEHCLVVSPGGNPELRSAAARWLAQAPAADGTWEYRCVRGADMAVFDSTMEMGGHRLELNLIRYAIAVDKETSQVNVQCYHPMFANLPQGMPEQITFLSLDWALGEQDVEIWVGEVGWTGTEPASPRTPQDLRAAVASISDDDQWVIMTAEPPDGTVLIATVAAPLRSARWPRFDLHVPVVLPYRGRTEVGLPDEASLEALRVFEDGLDAAIGGNGTVVAHETSRGQRTLHYYVDSQTNAQAQIAELLRTWPEGNAASKPVRDPAFKNVAHLMR